MDDFKKFLGKIKKSNGDKLLPKSIDVYDYYVSQYETNFVNREGEELVKYMNTILKQKNNIVIYSSFRNYLLYRGIKKDSELSRKLLVPEKNATAMSSVRFLQGKVLSKEELKMLYENVDDETRLIFSFLYDSAARRDELLKVKFGDIEYVDKTEDKSNVYAKVRLLGKGNIARYIFLSKLTVELLRKLRPTQNKEDRVFVFYDVKGNELKKQQDKLHTIVKSEIKRVLGRNLSPHCFRHSKATNLVENGSDILGVQKYLNHKNINSTMVYLNISSTFARKTFEEHSEDMLGETQ